jgi:hypothetical protein
MRSAFVDPAIPCGGAVEQESIYGPEQGKRRKERQKTHYISSTNDNHPPELMTDSQGQAISSLMFANNFSRMIVVTEFWMSCSSVV